MEGCTNTSVFEVDIHDPREIEKMETSKRWLHGKNFLVFITLDEGIKKLEK